MRNAHAFGGDCVGGSVWPLVCWVMWLAHARFLVWLPLSRQTSTGRSIVTGLLDFACKEEFKNANESKIEALCEAVGKDLIDFVPKINSLLGSLAWDVPKGFCSVFIPVCKQPCCDASAPTTPQQRHLSLTHNASEMAVTWVTLDTTDTSTVQWGPASASPTTLPFSSNGAANQRTYVDSAVAVAVAVIVTVCVSRCK